MNKNKRVIRYQQTIEGYYITVRVSCNGITEEIFRIEPADKYEPGKRALSWFSVTSNRGCDSGGNGLLFNHIEKAVSYIKDCVKNSNNY